MASTPTTAKALRDRPLAARGIAENLLPPSVAALAAVVGWPAAMVMVETFPGQTLEFTTRRSAVKQAIAEAIGDTATERLVLAYDGNPLYIPACAHLARAERNRRIREEVRDLERSISTRAAVARMARQWRLTERTIWRALSPTNVTTAAAPDVVLYQLPLI